MNTIEQKFMKEQKKMVNVIGLGHIGLPTALRYRLGIAKREFKWRSDNA